MVCADIVVLGPCAEVLGNKRVWLEGRNGCLYADSQSVVVPIEAKGIPVGAAIHLYDWDKSIEMPLTGPIRVPMFGLEPGDTVTVFRPDGLFVVNTGC